MSDQQSFSEEEVRKLLKRATQLQGGKIGDDSPSLSRDELREIAAETGIDSEYLTAAINESVHGISAEDDEIYHFWGDSMLLEDDIEFEGEISGDDWGEIENGINRSYGTIGTVRKTDNAVTWTVIGDIKKTQVRVSSSKGKTRIESLMKLTPYVFGSQMLTTIAFPLIFLFLFGIAEIASLSPAEGISGLFLSAVLGFFASRHLFKAFSRNKKKKFSRTAKEIKKILMRSESDRQQENGEDTELPSFEFETGSRILLDDTPDIIESKVDQADKNKTRA